MIRKALFALALSAAPAAAQAPEAWVAARDLCIAPFEVVSLPDTADLPQPAEALPDWVRPPAGARSWELPGGIWLSLAGTDDILATCSVQAQGGAEAIADAFADWARAQIAAGRYRPALADAPTDLISTIWREPRMRVSIATDPATGAVRITVREIDMEA